MSFQVCLNEESLFTQITIVVSDQGKEDNVLDNGEKKVSKKKKKSKKIYEKKEKVSSMKRYPKLFCNDCGASFIYKSELQRHINAIHLKLKPYECGLCEMSFARKGDLNVHVKVIHQQIRPFECDQCKKRGLLEITHAKFKL